CARTVAELRQLRRSPAGAGELLCGRAARGLNMAQPPLSVAIRQLEQEVGTPLFVRNSREVRLTEAGAAFVDGAKQTLAEADAALAAARRASEGQLGSLRLGYSWGARFETLPPLGEGVKRRRPPVGVRAREVGEGRRP